MESIFFEREQAMLPETQLLIEEKNRRANIKRRIDEINKMINEFTYEKTMLRSMLDTPESVVVEKKVFIKTCPDNDCRGFLSSQWKCGLCNKWSCPECNEVIGMTKDTEHVCNPDNVLSAALLKKDTKPCPKCYSNIYKIDGCDQMWCTQCHIAFSWKKNTIVTSKIHNPHYYEWMRNTHGSVPREPGDVTACGEFSQNTAYTLLQLAREYHLLPSLPPLGSMPRHRTALSATKTVVLSENITYLQKVIENILHNKHVLPRVNTDITKINDYLRIHYLKQDITEEQFKRSIQINYKTTQKQLEINQVFDLFFSVVYDILVRINNDMKSIKQPFYIFENVAILDQFLSPYIYEIQTIITHCNAVLYEISFTYSSKTCVINDKGRLEISHKVGKKEELATTEVKDTAV